MAKAITHIYLLILMLTVASAGVFVFLKTANPDEAKLWEFGLLYFIIFFWVWSLTSLLGYFLRSIIWKKGLRWEFLNTSRRQGIWFGLMAVIILMLETSQILNVWILILLLSVFTLVELYAR